MLGELELSDTSSSDPGRSGSLSPFNDMKSLYFNDELYGSKMHYRISKILDGLETDPDVEELVIDCKDEEEYNNVLDSLYKFGDGKMKIFGVSNKPHEFIIEPDPRDKYRKFNEEKFLAKGGD